MPLLVVLSICGFYYFFFRSTSASSTSYLGNMNVTRGLRNNNPFNLIRTNIQWQGKLPVSNDSKFEQFIDMPHGVRAGIINLRTLINEGYNTIRKLISVYAPTTENDTIAYENAVSKQTGLSLDQPFIAEKSTLANLSYAITRHEGQQISQSDFEAGFKLL